MLYKDLDSPLLYLIVSKSALRETRQKSVTLIDYVNVLVVRIDQ